MRTIILDNEPTQAVLVPTHPKHRVVMAHLAAVVVRRRKGALVTAIVPTAVRVEAGWDRRAPGVAAANRFRIGDVPLGTEAANVAAAIVTLTGVSVADAHVGVAALDADAGDVVVLTSEPVDIGRASSPRSITVVTI